VTYIGGVLHIVFVAFLFRDKNNAGYDAFVKNGWNTFHKKERLRIHVEDEFIDS
jgi:uncharacterized membrane protein YwzB